MRPKWLSNQHERSFEYSPSSCTLKRTWGRQPWGPAHVSWALHTLLGTGDDHGSTVCRQQSQAFVRTAQWRHRWRSYWRCKTRRHIEACVLGMLQQLDSFEFDPLCGFVFAERGAEEAKWTAGGGGAWDEFGPSATDSVFGLLARPIQPRRVTFEAERVVSVVRITTLWSTGPAMFVATGVGTEGYLSFVRMIY